MAVTIRERKLPGGGSHWQADIRVRLPDGLVHRERIKAPGRTKAQALRWARQREAHILRHGPRKDPGPSCPTFGDFAPRFMRDYVAANRLAPNTRSSYDVNLRLYLLPVLEDVPLDQIGPVHIQRIKVNDLKPATINNALKNLKSMLRQAVRWNLLAEVPEITRVKTEYKLPSFYDFDEYNRLVAAAAAIDSVTHAAVLLGGDAGLRRGEIRALRWANVQFERNRLMICENLTADGDLRPTKGGRPRFVPMSGPLRRLLESVERRGERVVCRADGRPYSARGFDKRMYQAQAGAGLPRKGSHILRHTFCSHLAMRGVHARKIQQLAGHSSLTTTEIYMHLAPSELDDAIRCLRPE